MSADAAGSISVEGLTHPDGTFALDRIGQLAPQAATVAAALEHALGEIHEAESPWLVPPLADRLDELSADVADSLPQARNAADALALAPSLLGADEVRTYVVLIGNPAEARELGGFTGGLGVLTADRGRPRLHLARRRASRRSASELAVREASRWPRTCRRRSWRAGRIASSRTGRTRPTSRPSPASPNQLWPVIQPGVAVDGVLYVDPYTVAAMLEITGPVQIEGVDVEISAATAVDYLLRDQYLDESFDSSGERKELIRETADAAFEILDGAAAARPARARRAAVAPGAGPEAPVHDHRSRRPRTARPGRPAGRPRAGAGER